MDRALIPVASSSTMGCSHDIPSKKTLRSREESRGDKKAPHHNYIPS